MTWMLTATGTAVDLRWMAQDTISLLDVAHHLAQINRYTGACSRPYCAAEHSLLVCDILERDGVYSASVLMAALMHDAHKAYTNDLSSPMKQLVGDPWRLEENRIQHAVLRKFGLVNAFTSHKARIRWADLTALATERVALLPPNGPQWEVSGTHEALTWVDFKSRERFTWLDWRQAFLDRFAELQFARSLQAKQLGAQPTTPRTQA
jgi:hypothetical protein